MHFTCSIIWEINRKRNLIRNTYLLFNILESRFFESPNNLGGPLSLLTERAELAPFIHTVTRLAFNDIGVQLESTFLTIKSHPVKKFADSFFAKFVESAYIDLIHTISCFVFSRQV